MKVQLTKQRRRRGQLVGWKLLGAQPGPTLVTEQIRGRAPWDKVAVQHRVHLVLQPSGLTHDMRPTQHLAAQRAGRGIRTPHRRQIVRGQQLSQNLGVDLVGLDLRLGDRPGLGRVGHHHPPCSAGQHRRDRPGVPGRLQRDLIARSQAFGERPHPFRSGGESAGLGHQPTLPDRYLRELPVHIQPNAPPLCLCLHRRSPSDDHHNHDRERVRETTPTDPRAAQLGRSQGRPTTYTGSQPTEQDRPAHPASLPAPLVPAGRTVCRPHPPHQQRGDQRNRRRHGLSYRLPTPSSG